MDLFITSNDPLVFRDGRPFGDAGHVNGGSLRWPWPSTISGVLRCKVGEKRKPDFFNGEQRNANIAEIRQIHCRTLPLWCERDKNVWQPLFPAPADALIMPGAGERELRVLPFTYTPANRNGGTDLLWERWMLPETMETGKPARNPPALWFQKSYFTWLQYGAFPSSTLIANQLGLSLPTLEMRMHTAIDQITATASTGRLFSSQGIRMATGTRNDQQRAGIFSIGVQAENLKPGDEPNGPCLLGGERKVAFINEGDNLFPPCPEWFDNKPFLRLILAAPGKFGAWAPEWLLPENGPSFKSVPGLSVKVRLRGAHIPRWAAISGWDMENNRPKAFSKLVPAGSVYLLELEEPNASGEFARYLWGKSINNDPDGFGLTYIGNLDLTGEQA